MKTQTITPQTFADLAARLDDIATRVQSCCPDQSVQIETEADYDAVSLSLARIMKTCALALIDAGYDTENALAEAEAAIADQERLQARRAVACPGCGREPGEHPRLGCRHPEGCGYLVA